VVQPGCYIGTNSIHSKIVRVQVLSFFNHAGAGGLGYTVKDVFYVGDIAGMNYHTKFIPI
jgi:NADH/NAD ratio-sensing transcriptional regulator Rex